MTRRRDDPLLMIVLAAAGSALGGALRWCLSMTALNLAGLPAAWSLLAVNCSGSFAIGLYAALIASEGRLRASPGQRVFIIAGLCGGFTSFSLFSLETLLFIETGKLFLASIHTGISLAGWLAGAWLGYACGAHLNQLRRSRR